MKRKVINSLLVLLAVSSMFTTTGCSVFTSEDVASYPLDSMLTTQEVIDYYAEGLSYESRIKKNLNVHETTYEKKEITGTKAEQLKSLQAKAEKILGKEKYKATKSNMNIVSPDTYEYIRNTFDNEVLTGGQIKAIDGALGYYFVDVEYNVGVKQPGTYNNKASLVGLTGAFYQDYRDKYMLDATYLGLVTNAINDYYKTNKITKAAIFDNNSGDFIIEDVKEVGDKLTEENLDAIKNGTYSVEDDESVDIDTSMQSNKDVNEEEEDELEEDSASKIDGVQYEEFVSEDRKIKFDASLINSIVGSSLRASSQVPELSFIYEIPKQKGDIEGYGLNYCGGNGLRVFGYNRNEMSGTVTLRYVFKESSDGTGEVIGTNIYIVNESLTNGYTSVENNVLLPDFLQSQLEQTVDRADRVQANCDIAGMMSGKLYEDIGYGILRGQKDKSTSLLKYESKINNVLARDTNYNCYLLDIETTVKEGPKDVDAYGTYTDRYLMVIQQQGDEFRIIDQVRTSRTLMREPDINPDSTTKKRLVALGLSGEVLDENKGAIRQLLGELYTAGTNRVLHASEDEPKEITAGGEKIQITKGVADCFQNDRSVLREDKYNYMISSLQTLLIKHGVQVTSVYNGTVVDWIGGYENQVEFTTEELVDYRGTGEGHYMQVYYLVSKLNDVWVIDERKILNEEDVKGSDVETIQQRIGS